jgi:uncharacterized protein YbjT (DUF2867 family)
MPDRPLEPPFWPAWVTASSWSRRLCIAALVGLLAWGAPFCGSATENPSKPAVFVVGGTRGTGLEVVKLLRARGELVTALARPQSDASLLEDLGARVVRGDAMSASDVRAAMVSGAHWAVISTLGGQRGDDNRPDFEGNRNVIDAANETGVKRFVLVSTVGAGKSKKGAPALVRWFLRKPIELKEQAEEYLVASGLNYTIVRPGRLIDRAPSRKAVLVEDPAAFSSIARADLASLLVDALYDTTTERGIYTAYDASR